MKCERFLNQLLRGCTLRAHRVRIDVDVGVGWIAPTERQEQKAPLVLQPVYCRSQSSLSLSLQQSPQVARLSTPSFGYMSSNPRDPDSFYAKLRNVLLAYTETRDPDVQVAADFRRDLVQAWTVHELPEMRIPTESIKELHSEVIDALVKLQNELRAAATSNNNASEPVKERLVCAFAGPVLLHSDQC